MMGDLAIGALYALGAGITMVLGALAARFEVFKAIPGYQQIRHGLVAVGAGALISAIAFVLVPEGIEHQSKSSVIWTFLAGGVSFMLCDRALARSGSKVALFLAMLLDFVPEVCALGVLVARGKLNQSAFVAMIIAVQNFPEGYMAYEELTESGRSDSPKSHDKLLLLFLLTSVSGPPLMWIGAKILAGQNELVAMLMTFCAGGILYLVFQDVAPKVTMQNHWGPSLGAVVGFVVGLCGLLFV